MTIRNRSQHAALASLVMFGTATADAAQADAATQYPNRPVRFLVPFQAGGANDLTARVIAQKLTERWGRQVVPDNRPGAAGSLGVDAAVRAVPDGYTIAIISASLAVNSAVSPKLPYELTKDLQAISQVSSLFYIVTLHPSVPAHAPDVAQRFSSDGSTPVGSTPEAFGAHIRNEVAKWRRLAKEAGLRME